ncbi:secreted protein/lipoprotein [Streptomyces sp. NPDC059979]|uniref:secreted protein/lipoprotein n=1 Tax=Streptomyces sp. NPDC059979 TaxID=3347021 RepID=UPI0036C0BCAD
MEKSYATGRIEGTDIKKYAAGAALTRPETEVPKLEKAGRVFTGDVGINNPTVTKADLERKIPSVTLSSCIDVARWIPVDRASGKPAALPTERLTKFIAITTMEKWPDGWKVLTDEPQSGRPC